MANEQNLKKFGSEREPSEAAVSYTHLDVYKRQAYRDDTQIVDCQCRKFYSENPRVEAVSYTHLDVYKRQI